MEDPILQFLDLLVFKSKAIYKRVINISVCLEELEIFRIRIVALHKVIAMSNLTKYSQAIHLAEFVRKTEISLYQRPVELGILICEYFVAQQVVRSLKGKYFFEPSISAN